MTPDKKLLIRKLKAAKFSDAEIEAQMDKTNYTPAKDSMGTPNRMRSSSDGTDLFEKTDMEMEDGSSESSGGNKAAAGMAMGLARGDSGMDIAQSGLMMSGNPYAMGAGLGLAVLSAGAKRRQQEQELKAKMKLDRISKQQAAIQNLMNLSQGMGL